MKSRPGRPPRADKAATETDDSSAMSAAKRHQARARCAEILNARKVGS